MDGAKALMVGVIALMLTVVALTVSWQIHVEAMAKSGMCQRYQPGCGTLWVKCEDAK